MPFLPGSEATVRWSRSSTRRRTASSAGDAVTMNFANGSKPQVDILGLYRDPMLFTGGSQTKSPRVTVSASLFEGLGLPTDMEVTMVRGVPGTDPDRLKAAVEAALAEYPTQSVYTQEGYKAEPGGQIDMILSMLYALLAMSVIISVFGIVNTLVLTVYERTRELGMLRAIGTSRRQLRRMVRYESVITSAIGGVLGIGVGVVFAYVVITRYAWDGFDFAVPYLQLVVFLAVAVMVGVAAAVLPARRAAQNRHPGGDPPRVRDEPVRPEVPPLPRGAPGLVAG